VVTFDALFNKIFFLGKFFQKMQNLLQDYFFQNNFWKMEKICHQKKKIDPSLIFGWNAVGIYINVVRVSSFKGKNQCWIGIGF
jgi:hypothetical protein